MDTAPQQPECCDQTQVERREGIAVMHFTRQPLFATTNLRERARILNCLQQLISDTTVKAIVLMGAPDKSGAREYGEFLDIAAASDDKFIYKMLTMFNQIILDIVRAPKAVIFSDSGAVLSQFLHVSLACDYRLFADDTVFEKGFLEHGMVPKGGGAFFLRRMLGAPRAFALLTDPSPMTAAQALELGLINETCSAAALEDTAMERARALAAIPAVSVHGVKSLLHFPVQELEAYLEHENLELFRAFTRMRTDRKRKSGKM